MKKLVAFILIVAYSVNSFGMTLHLHYCCGKLDKISLSSKAPTACKVKTVMENTGCCNNKEFELKIKVDQEAGSQQIISFAPQQLISFPVYSSQLFFSPKMFVSPVSTGPPLFLWTTPLFIQYCNYRI